MNIGQIQSREFSEKRRTVLPLLEERAGVRTDVETNSGQYCEDLQNALNFFGNQTNELDKKFSGLNHFTSELLKLLENQIRAMDALSDELKKRNKLLQQDTKVLCRYVSLFFRVKTQLNLIIA